MTERAVHQPAPTATSVAASPVPHVQPRAWPTTGCGSHPVTLAGGPGGTRRPAAAAATAGLCEAAAAIKGVRQATVMGSWAPDVRQCQHDYVRHDYRRQWTRDANRLRRAGAGHPPLTTAACRVGPAVQGKPEAAPVVWPAGHAICDGPAESSRRGRAGRLMRHWQGSTTREVSRTCVHGNKQGA